MPSPQTGPARAPAPRGGVSRRAFSLADASAINVEARTVELAFSSTEPYQRWWGTEILSHSPDAVRLGRLNNRAALLDNHDADELIGVVEKAWLDGAVGRAIVRFSKNAEAEAIFQDLIDGIRSKVSVGYLVHAYQLLSKSADTETYEITDWEPFEISIVSIPADDTVGVGRAMGDGFFCPTQTPNTTEFNPTPTQETRSMTDTATPTPTPATAPSAQDFRSHAAEIFALGEKENQWPMAARAVEQGLSVEQFKAMLRHARPAAQPTPSAPVEIGMSKKDLARYSVVRALRAQAFPEDAKTAKDCAFEIECSRAAAQALDRPTRGMTIPSDVMQQRDMVVGTPTAGGNLVATDLGASSMIDLLRAKLVFADLGSTVLNNLQGNLSVPRQTGGATAYWVAENAAPTASQAAVDQVPLTPKTLAAVTRFSRRMLLQSSIDIEMFVRADLMRVMALAVENAVLNGTGSSNQPRGLFNQSGVLSVALGTNGAAPTWDAIIGMESAIAAANADVNSMAYLTNAVMRGKLKRTQKFSGTNGDPIWEGNGQMNGYRTAVTNQVPSNLTKGSGTSLSAILFGNWADVLIALWSGMDLMTDPYSSADSGTVRVVAFQDVDVAIRHPESFCLITDGITV